MDPNTLTTWIKPISLIITTFSGMIAGFWAYLRYVVDRGLTPAVEFNIECNEIGEQSDSKLIELLLHIKNVGSDTLIANNIRAGIKYITPDDEVKVFYDNRKFGRVIFPKSVSRDLTSETNGQSDFNVTHHQTFVPSGVDKIYTFCTVVPANARYLFVYAEFSYANRPSGMQNIVIKISHAIGITPYKRYPFDSAINRIERVIPLKS